MVKGSVEGGVGGDDWELPCKLSECEFAFLHKMMWDSVWAPCEWFERLLGMRSAKCLVCSRV